MTSRTTSKRASSNGQVDKEKAEPKLQLLRVALQWTAVYTEDDEPPEEVTSQVLTVSARDWPQIGKQIDGDLARLVEQIIEAGGFEEFKTQLQAQQAQMPR